METFGGWLKFSLYATAGALATVFVFHRLRSHYEDLQEPWFFILTICCYSLVVAVTAALHNESRLSREDGL